MNFRKIENEALHLPERDRAELVRRLLNEPNRVPTDRLPEAQRRAGELHGVIFRPVPSEEVARRAQPMDVAFLRSLEGTLNEWISEADEEAWRDL
uniref:Uncharacterized protein n=1 Tax=Candidatus Kentrum eta TaxID=2126337 RepID=A0A450UQG7_9GAMM|nr:MAG: hypothetical protein BECKH772A_GA0070896_100699 [Candidatus Kentron sp. H]VFJ94813.1 MAG: hypothetical protein BECKH772B_GA0070898_100679 [Candidatus Kentron sp. H]VFK01293.1 MAG: hypothetical protein BECKH772C_GA0070978_100629 [Candidatus Kentron sp. H]